MSTQLRRRLVSSSFCLLALALPCAASAQGKYAELNGARIYYEDEGSGHPLVLIHGWPMSARMWDEQARVLKNYYRVIRYDRRGFGRSPGQPWKESSAEHDQTDLVALLGYLKISSAYVLGHSQGASVATQFTLDHPKQVDALILHGSPVEGFVFPETGPFANHDSTRQLVRQGMPVVRRRWLAEPINHVPPGKPEVAALIASIVEQYSGADLLQPTPPAPAHVPAIQRLHEIKVPTLILIGGEDLPFFQTSADVIAFEIPSSHKISIPGGGHLVNMLEPERYNAEVLRFLRAVAGGRVSARER